MSQSDRQEYHWRERRSRNGSGTGVNGIKLGSRGRSEQTDECDGFSL